MLLRRADFLSLAYMVGYPALIGWQWVNGVEWYLYLVVLVMSVGLSVVQHNHTHLRMWSSKPLNRITDLWLSILQATPSFVFFPSHISNHHRYKHGPEDETRTYRFGGHHNNIIGYLLHPLQALYVLPNTLITYARKRANTRDYWPLVELGLIAVVSVVLAWMDAWLWLTLVLVPQMHGLHWLLGANYLQHAGAEPGTGPDAATDGRLAFSRNFTGWVNLVWFNIGYHTAHHENGRTHWSDLPTHHKEYVERVPGHLMEHSLSWYMIRVLIFGKIKTKVRVAETR
jgi:hypothetical protein|tara:strand:- start:139 stop:993 length:855 start_codon:yes stop_codon:yes gene_type:complete